MRQAHSGPGGAAETVVWAGTPTPNTPSAHVAHLQPLLAFLGQQPFGMQRRIWEVLPIDGMSAAPAVSREYGMVLCASGFMLTGQSSAAPLLTPKDKQ